MCACIQTFVNRAPFDPDRHESQKVVSGIVIIVQWVHCAISWQRSMRFKQQSNGRAVENTVSKQCPLAQRRSEQERHFGHMRRVFGQQFLHETNHKNAAKCAECSDQISTQIKCRQIWKHMLLIRWKKKLNYDN